jgi:hypothetical protein
VFSVSDGLAVTLAGPTWIMALLPGTVRASRPISGASWGRRDEVHRTSDVQRTTVYRSGYGLVTAIW